MPNESFNAFEEARRQLQDIIANAGLDDAVWNFLRDPMREYRFAIPVRMDDGRLQMFQGYRVQHNDARGPCAGGIRFHPQATLNTIRARAMWMTWKCAVINIPLGGANGCVICDPHNLSMNEQEQICKGYIRHMARNLGPTVDIPGPDIFTNAQHMLWMMDEYEAVSGGKYPGVITGKPIGMGGALGRIEAPGYGLVFTLREALKMQGLRPDKVTVSLQGFGTVGQHCARLLEQIGCRIICVACWNQHDQMAYSFRKNEGIYIKDLLSITNRFGEIEKNKAEDCGYEVLSDDAWLEQDVDILIPAAFENQITAANVDKIGLGVKIIAEGANGPTSPEADEIIKQRGIFLIPDCLANAGGIACSYFEQVQNNMNYYWEKDEVLGKLDVLLTSAFLAVTERAEKHKMYLRQMAQAVAVERVAQSCRDRGWLT
ncbi:MAG: Glu/Leu/Phe/Val dehydrogenase [FCB group bacterium]|nr:Glu/Leu/Phe/Val dehydrogenase [FCB group bacterium]